MFLCGVFLLLDKIVVNFWRIIRELIENFRARKREKKKMVRDRKGENFRVIMVTSKNVYGDLKSFICVFQMNSFFF